mgnify:FL=1
MIKKIDAVFTWVDGNDIDWISRKSNFIDDKPEKLQNKKVNSKGRFFDNDELKYSLRSIYQFAPWINNIYIITDNQTPKWLNINHPKIHIIDHKEIFNSKNLPSYNSMAIEMNLHKINGLNNFFLSFNDDFFIGRMTSPEDFFQNGKPKLFSGKKRFTLEQLSERKSGNEYFHANNNARMLIYKKYNFFPNFNLRHGIKVLDKKILNDLEAVFLDDFENTRSSNFRTKKDVWPIALYSFYLVAQGLNKPYYLAPLRKNLLRYNFKFLRKGRDYTYLPLTTCSLKKIKSKFNAIKKYKPLMFCINDGPNVIDQKRILTKNFLHEYFPDKSIYEK